MTTPVPDSNGTYGSSSAFTSTTTFDYNTGLPLTVTDPNGAVTEMEYDDPLLRPTKVIAANGQQTITEYGEPDTNGQLPETERFVKIKSQFDADHLKEAYTWFDGLGRTIRTQSVDDAGDVFVMTCYDDMGRVSKVTNPFRGYTSQTCSTTTGLDWTTNTFDSAGRPWKVTTPDSAVVETTYSLATSGSQIGTVVTVEDQADKLRRSITNALGHLIRVDEPNSINALGNIDAPNQPTYYDYDLLSNLTKVRQGGTYSNPEQSRDFVYDALSRLKQATNPESGTIQYTYDSNSNLATKTDARGIVTTYTYDRLNRVTERSYAAPSPTPQNYQATPTANYYYDNLTNAKGKLIKVSSSVSTTEYTGFDILGRVTSHKQTTDGTDYTTAYVYNLAGALIEETYPSTRKVKNTLDSNGDLAMVQSKKNSASGYWSYANSFTYNPAGAVTSMQLGNGRWESTIFNSRLQPTETNLGTVQNGYDQLRLQYSYGDWVSGSVDATKNNGNIVQQVITVPTAGTSNGFTATQKYYYDPLNRIDDATEDTGGSQTWRQDFSYDRYGNRNFVEANTTTIPRLCGTSPNFTICTADHKKYNPGINTSNDNRINTSEDYAFDSSGNTTGDSEGRTFIYDGENKQVEVRDSGNNIIGQYVYDGDGKRIKKYVPATGETTIFVYDAAGKEIAEYSTIVASAQDAKVAYLTNDHLGSPRINTDQNGAVTARHDYHPFGEEITTSQRVAHVEYGGDSVRKQFTGYERDDETELDFAQARYYSSLSGRFFIPDDFSNDTDIFDPASWNLYAYVRNNPIKNIDPSGERIYIEFEDSDGNLQTVQYYRGKLYTTSKDKKGNLVRGAEYTGDNQYANDAKNYLNDLRTDQESELGKRISDLESNKLTNTIKKDPNDPGRDEAVATNPDALRKGIPTGTTVYWSDKPHPITAWDYAPSYIVPAYAALAHELLGHSWDANRGIDNPQDSFPVRPENGKPTFIPFGIREPAAVEIENQARRYAGDETRKWYGKYEIPKPPPPALKPGPGRPRRRGTR